jgi:hypothetical protein
LASPLLSGSQGRLFVQEKAAAMMLMLEQQGICLQQKYYFHLFIA